MPQSPSHPAPLPVQSARSVAWTVHPGLIGYEEAVAAMEARVLAIAEGAACELIWLVEHPALYTAGTSAKLKDLVEPGCLPVHWTGRGGQFTYHGPGQRVVYVMLDVRTRFGNDIHLFTRSLENWMIGALNRLGVTASTIEGRTGVWVRASDPEETGEPFAKIAAIGLRIRRGISFHGVALNIDPDLAHYRGIVPCGLIGSRATSLAALGHPATAGSADAALKLSFANLFGVRIVDDETPARV